MSGFFGALLDLLFPPRCIFCRKLLQSGEQGYCARCGETLPRTRGKEAEQTGEFFSLCVSPLWYQDKVRDSFHRFKFSGRTGYAKVYGHFMAECVRGHLAGRYDLITWVPLSGRSLKKRGYDQAMLLAMTAALELEDVAVETLVKVRSTNTQSRLTEDSARKANVLGAYRVTDAELVSGHRILLIDDIVTTGSTISECARMLLTAGAEEVLCATLARARK
ncbi:hypothetical protein SDC9_58073 [bioreactor metagenome]|uniref:Phosphoribosyltransferase domain-containing protein n=1 Tax=bioreactor metagenome TaxID=1076179 RepID=A0A644XC04_9ZZZZ